MSGKANKALYLFHALRILCAASMFSLGLSHQALSAIRFTPTAHLEEQYRLPDGTFSVICEGNHGVDDGSSGNHTDLAPRCEACILASSLLIPTGDDNVWLITHFTSLGNIRFYRSEGEATHTATNYNARAPPNYNM
jgi:hypothetical protein